MHTEAQIRDYLANNLDLIESGLHLVGTEYVLQNNESKYGFIDILAKDRFGILVIIEIKKSSNSARSAIHELHKYVGLMKQIHKVQNGKIRCVLLSKEWGELILPFSKFVYETPNYQAQGYQIIVDEHQSPQSCERVALIPQIELVSQIEACPYHTILLYSERSRKDEAEVILKNVLEEMGLILLVFSMEYQGKSKNVIYPFAHYLIVYEEIFEQMHQLEELVENEVEQEPERWSLEQKVLSNIQDSLFKWTNDMENGYPEKFDWMLDNGWNISETLRYGNEISAEEIYSEEELVRKIRGWEGQHISNYHAEVSPQNAVRWNEVKRESAYALVGNEEWEEAAELYFKEIEAIHAADDISITVYNPGNTIMTLLKFLESPSKYTPMFEITIKERASNRIKILFSTLHWNGKAVDQSPEEIISSTFGSINGYLAYNHFQHTYFKEIITLFKHGLFYKFAELYIENEQPKSMLMIYFDENEIIRSTESTEQAYGLDQFAKKHRHYLQELKIYMENCGRF